MRTNAKPDRKIPLPPDLVADPPRSTPPSLTLEDRLFDFLEDHLELVAVILVGGALAVVWLLIEKGH